MSKKICSILPIAALALGVGGQAVAGAILTDPVVMSFGPSTPAFAQSLTFDQFNPADFGGAPLDSVHLKLTGTANAGPGGDVNCRTGGDTSGQCEGTVNSSITIDMSVAGVDITQVIPLTAFDYLMDEGVILDIPFDTDTAMSEVIIDLGDSAAGDAIIALFEGAGTIDVDVDGIGMVVAASIDGDVAPFNPLIGLGEVSLRYDYDEPTQVPEPATLALLGAGLLGLGARRRRKVVND